MNNFWDVLEQLCSVPEKQDWIGEAAEFIKKFEGYHTLQANGDCTAYRDPVGVWTIGWGTTRLNGRPVKNGDRLTSAEADRVFRTQLEDSYVAKLAKTIPDWSQMSSGKKIALTSFAYNLGAAFFGHTNFSTITSALESKRGWAKVPAALKLYRNPGSNVESGLLRRRIAEGDLWKR